MNLAGLLVLSTLSEDEHRHQEGGLDQDEDGRRDAEHQPEQVVDLAGKGSPRV